MKKNIEIISKTAIDVILGEARAVNNLLEHIDESFFSAVNLMFGCKGRLIISGVGKSALIAQKIVATLNSTGTPALFMHSADAVHGDLGMILEDDIVLFISKSGNTAELKRLLPFVKKMGNPLVAMVSNLDSYLAHHSDYVIYAPIESEVCPNNLAPTTSTTVQLVLGDAIAMALMRLRNFTAEDFAKFHPGGSLGKRLYMRVEDVFDKTNRPWVAVNEAIRNTIITISSHRLGATVVLGENKELMGIITDGDVRRMVERGEDMDAIKAGDIMSTNPKTIDINALAVDAFGIMEKNEITSVVVLENGRYMGLVHIHDIMREGIG